MRARTTSSRQGLAAGPRPWDWRDDAACREELGHDPETWYPVGTTGPAAAQIAEAKQVCRRCPVVGQCLVYAFDLGIDHGIWGGQTEEERRKFKRRSVKRRRPAA